MSSEIAGPEAMAPPGNDVAVRLRGVSKHYAMFRRPEDRFRQMVVPRLQRLVGRTPSRYFTDFAALSGVSFEVRRGETVGIVGRNGSGKSTLLQIVCGTLRPTTGSVEVNGRIAALLELGAGFNPEFTGRENVLLNAAILGVPQAEMAWRFDDIARFADIGPFLDQPVKTYSSGMYVRLAFATAINVDPDILVVDEALAVGDEAFQRKCYARIEEIKERGGTILFVSHGAQTIVHLCTHALLFDRGELLLSGRPKTVVNQYQRLINASPQAAGDIREEVRTTALRLAATSNAVEDEMPAYVDAHGEDAAIANSSRASEERDGIAGPLEFFDPHLLSGSMVEQAPRGARIRDARLSTPQGETVNVITVGRRYSIRYLVEFDEDAEHVGFGAWFKTVEGLALAGAHTINAPEFQTRIVGAGDIHAVEYAFTCRVLPGAYFITCGVIGSVGGERMVMHRLTDVLHIRVMAQGPSIAAGHFDMGFVARTETVGRRPEAMAKT